MRKAGEERRHDLEQQAAAEEHRAREAAERNAAWIARMPRIDATWATQHRALTRLSALTLELERMHKQETKLLRERDHLVAGLRRVGVSWAQLASRTRLSRQALLKRMPERGANPGG